MPDLDTATDDRSRCRRCSGPWAQEADVGKVLSDIASRRYILSLVKLLTVDEGRKKKREEAVVSKLSRLSVCRTLELQKHQLHLVLATPWFKSLAPVPRPTAT